METQYFASANSYRGFYSLLGNIFDSRKFDRIFVLKGGPGTGKSTLIKRVIDFAKSSGGSARLYYCSSDINSLDGAVISIGEKKFAIIDGTAPHERDAILVGAIDEIVNLGDGIDTDWIRAHRDDIINLTDQKSKAYKTAYSYLQLAGECFDAIYKKKLECFEVNSAVKYIEDLSINSNCKTIKAEKCFISSFSKAGYRSFSLCQGDYEEAIGIEGDEINKRILLKLISDKFEDKLSALFSAPLSPNLPEAMVVNKCLITSLGNTKTTVSADEFFMDSKTNKEEIKLMMRIHGELLDEAIRWLSIASDIHFRLEDIYVKCMNFHSNEAIFEKISKKILKVCECDN